MKNNMTSKARTAMLFSASLLAVVGLQNTGAAQATNIQPVSNTTPSNTPGSGPALEQRYPRYVLQREDTVLLSFPLSPELNQTVTIQPDGYINLQNAGSVYVRGMTVPELVVAVKKAYGGILHDPIVDADLKVLPEADVHGDGTGSEARPVRAAAGYYGCRGAGGCGWIDGYEQDADVCSFIARRRIGTK